MGSRVAVPELDTRFRSLFAAHHDAIRAYCLRRLPVDDADDALSEIYLVAWRRRDDVPPGDEARLWLFGVARNIVRTAQRAERRKLRLSSRLRGLAAPSARSPETVVVAGAEYQEVIAAYQRLSERDREILRLRLWEELSVKDTAAVLRISPKAVSKRYQRALQRLAARSGSVDTGPRQVVSNE